MDTLQDDDNEIKMCDVRVHTEGVIDLSYPESIRVDGMWMGAYAT